MRPEAESVHYETARSFEVTPSGNHGKLPMTETPFFSTRSIISTSSILQQPSPPPYIPFGTITTPLPRSFSVSEIIITTITSVYVIIPIPIPCFAESTTITTITPLTLHACTTFVTIPTTKPYDTKRHPSDYKFSTPTSFTSDNET